LDVAIVGYVIIPPVRASLRLSFPFHGFLNMANDNRRCAQLNSSPRIPVEMQLHLTLRHHTRNGGEQWTILFVSENVSVDLLYCVTVRIYPWVFLKGMAKQTNSCPHRGLNCSTENGKFQNSRQHSSYGIDRWGNIFVFIVIIICCNK